MWSDFPRIRVKFWIFVFTNFGNLSATWDGLGEMVQHVAKDHMQPSKLCLTCQRHREDIWCLATWRWIHAERSSYRERTSASVTSHIHLSTAHPSISQNKSIGKMSKIGERNIGKSKSVEDQSIQGISKVEGEKSRGHCTVWGIRDVTSEVLTVKIWTSHPHICIRYPGYWHKQNWEKWNIIWFYFKLLLQKCTRKLSLQHNTI